MKIMTYSACAGLLNSARKVMKWVPSATEIVPLDHIPVVKPTAIRLPSEAELSMKPVPRGNLLCRCVTLRIGYPNRHGQVTALCRVPSFEMRGVSAGQIERVGFVAFELLQFSPHTEPRSEKEFTSRFASMCNGS